jgi:predicted transcriptional regulator
LIQLCIKIMRLSENEIVALIIITRSREPVHPRTLQKELGIQKGSVSRLLTSLQNKGLIERAGGEIILAETPPAEAFKKLYYAHRASPLQEILSGRRVELLSRMGSSQKSLETLAEETGISSDTVYYYLQDFLSMGIVSRSKEGKAYFYSFNYIIWPELKEFVTALMGYQILRLVPRDALLIKSYENSVLFKSLRPLDATLTSFSVYGGYGIELRLRDYYYTLPKRKLSVGEIFTHSLDSANSIYQRLYCILFYLKNKESLKGLQHPMMEDIRAVLRGERLKGYPTQEEIEEQAKLYGIQDIEP